MRERVTTGAPGALKRRPRLLVSRVKRMHMIVLLCKKPGLSCPKGFLPPQYLLFYKSFHGITTLCTRSACIRGGRSLCPLAWDSTSHGVGGAMHVHIPSHRRVPGDALREHVTTGSKIPPEVVEARMVSCIPRMHAMVSLCKKPGLSCPKTGVIVPQNRGYRAPKPGLSCPKFFLPLSYL
jgi:hypothetical protein